MMGREHLRSMASTTHIAVSNVTISGVGFVISNGDTGLTMGVSQGNPALGRYRVIDDYDFLCSVLETEEHELCQPVNGSILGLPAGMVARARLYCLNGVEEDGCQWFLPVEYPECRGDFPGDRLCAICKKLTKRNKKWLTNQ